MMWGQARSPVLIIGFDNHMIAGNRACSTSTPTRRNRTMPRPWGQGHLADAGIAIGAWFEAAAEPAGLVAHVNDLEHGEAALQVDPSAAQAGELAEP
jgi:hypothetical protein